MEENYVEERHMLCKCKLFPYPSTSSYLTCCPCISGPNTLTRCLEESPAKGAEMATWVMLRINLTYQCHQKV